MGDINVLVRSLREFARNDAILKALRVTLREPVDPVRKRIKMKARADLPHGGGLGAWVAGARITAQVTLTGRAAGIRLRGGRQSKGNLRGTAGARTDLRSIDRGRVRHPSWGRRFRGQWFTQTVPDGFFTRTAAESPEWEVAINKAIDMATGEINA